MSGEAFTAREDLGRDFLHRIELSLRRAAPFAAEIRGADRWILEKARRIYAATGHGFAHPHFIAWAAKVVRQPFAAHFERLPRFQQSSTARTV